jgi:hypothetical protein
VLRLPGGCATTCTPESRISSPVSTSLRSAAAEQRGKELGEVGVDRVERLLQEIARLAVDLADRRLRAWTSPR